jgi:3-deoxy-D-manno-octulosonate 8-phosphate phosphatase KdsC-like HAD superfamily phosphatase
VEIGSLTPTFSGKQLYIECKRGSKSENKYNSKDFLVKDGNSIDLAESFDINATLLQNPATKKYEPRKDIVFSLVEVN